MNKTLYRVLLASALMACTSLVSASEQAGVSPRDMTWMKQQQQAMDAFKQNLQGQTLSLPPEQQALINRMQGDVARQQGERPGGEKKMFPAIYFVSLGLPREGLLPMLRDANRYGIPATLRGLVNNDMKATTDAVMGLVKAGITEGVQIDPTLYSQYNIRSVPALVVRCKAGFDVIQGNIRLKQALEKVVEKGDCAETARKLLGGA